MDGPGLGALVTVLRPCCGWSPAAIPLMGFQKSFIHGRSLVSCELMGVSLSR